MRKGRQKGQVKAKSIITKTPYDAVDLSTLYKLDENVKQKYPSGIL